jgi:hypothetical protein
MLNTNVTVQISGEYHDYYIRIGQDDLVAEVKKGKDDLEKRLASCSIPTKIGSTAEVDCELVVTPDLIDESIQEFLDELKTSRR